METYGQFCPVAMAAEVLTRRWTPLVVRELLCGSRRFNDLHRGVPRISRSLLSRRLVELEGAGVVERRVSRDGRPEYHLTQAGRELEWTSPPRPLPPRRHRLRGGGREPRDGAPATRRATLGR